MKDCNETIEKVLKNIEQRNIEKKRMTGVFKKWVVGLICCCLVTVFGVGVMRGDRVVPIASDSPYAATQSNDNEQLEVAFNQHIEQESQAWLSADDVLKTDNVTHMGVCVPSFLSWKGGFYGCTETATDDRFVLTEEEVWFNPDYRYAIYQIKDEPDCIAIYINGKLQAYKKVFDVIFEINGVAYGIQYGRVADVERVMGNKVLFNDGFVVHEVLGPDNQIKDKEYLVNILPILKEQFPGLFSGNENYGDAWQMAVPLNEP